MLFILGLFLVFSAHIDDFFQSRLFGFFDFLFLDPFGLRLKQ